VGIKYYTRSVSRHAAIIVESPGANPIGNYSPRCGLKLEKQGQDNQLEDREATRLNLEVLNWMGAIWQRRETQSNLLSNFVKPPSTNLCFYHNPIIPLFSPKLQCEQQLFLSSGPFCLDADC
jgi:hypothetical protein